MRLFLVAATVLSAVCGVARAQDRVESDQIFFPNSGPRGTQEYKAGDVIARLPILWEKAGKLQAQVEVKAGDKSRVIPAGALLPAETLLVSREGKETMTGYCTPREAAERTLDKGLMGAWFGGSLTRKMVRDATDSQFCLVDRDNDGSADASLMVGSGWGVERELRAIDPVRIEPQRFVPVSESSDEVRIVFTRANRSGPELKLEILQQGKTRGFDSIGGTPRIVQMPVKQGLPLDLQMFGIALRLTGYDRAAGKVSIEWPADVQADRALAISDGLRYVMRY